MESFVSFSKWGCWLMTANEMRMSQNYDILGHSERTSFIFTLLSAFRQLHQIKFHQQLGTEKYL